MCLDALLGWDDTVADRLVFKREMLNAQRKKLKLTASDVAARVGVSVTTWNNWVNGSYEPKREKFKKLCKVLRLEENELLVPIASEVDESSCVDIDMEGAKKRLINGVLGCLLATSTLEDTVKNDGYVFDAGDLVELKSHLENMEKFLWVVLKKYGDL